MAIDISDKILAALIAAAVSIITALVSYLLTLRKLKDARESFDKEIDHRYIDKLYEKRIELYPKAFELAGKIRQKKGVGGINPTHEQTKIKESIVEWAEGEAGLFMSTDLVEAYYELIRCLAKQPGLGDEYSPHQVDNLWKARTKFRSCLRRDVGILHSSLYKNTH
ncbi:hypothetical protein [Motiliproteus sp. SC1-56]|uniref:hypothetical protein n=1 Tax=Motiliproteus sp. SC1-56 TaxID=2799565 RepID=UPI001A8C0DB8|nr:hypothetical protein [Motiliproteus sp. SC1-56]